MWVPEFRDIRQMLAKKIQKYGELWKTEDRLLNSLGLW